MSISWKPAAQTPRISSLLEHLSSDLKPLQASRISWKTKWTWLLLIHQAFLTRESWVARSEKPSNNFMWIMESSLTLELALSPSRQRTELLSASTLPMELLSKLMQFSSEQELSQILNSLEISSKRILSVHLRLMFSCRLLTRTFLLLVMSLTILTITQVNARDSNISTAQSTKAILPLWTWLVRRRLFQKSLSSGRDSGINRCITLVMLLLTMMCILKVTWENWSLLLGTLRTTEWWLCLRWTRDLSRWLSTKPWSRTSCPSVLRSRLAQSNSKILRRESTPEVRTASAPREIAAALLARTNPLLLPLLLEYQRNLQ